MEVEFVKAKLIEMLKDIQCDSGYPDTEVDGDTCPLDLDGFDSKIWPVAIGMIAEALHLDIPSSENIFLSKDGKHRLTIDEIATTLCNRGAIGGTTP